uniref:Plastid movement impaired 2 n=1 Tax=Davidia involucrata TaxID=16924 RepID=A0A5B7BXL2_DAVIN
MGNSLGGKKKTAKVMKINGETVKLKTPVRAGEVVKDYPGHVLLESEAVKHFGIRAKPLEVQQELKPKRLYFLVELPKVVVEEKSARRVRSGIHMSAKDRLESLMLSRRSASDLSIMKPKSIVIEERGSLRVKMRLPKAEVAKLMMESKDEAEAAEKIVGLCMAANGGGDGGAGGGGGAPPKGNEGSLLHQQVHWKGAREKRVGFLPINEGEIQLAVAS